MNLTPLDTPDLVRIILLNVGAHTVPSVRLVCRDWKVLIEEVQALHTTELGSAFSPSYIKWLKSQNLFICINIAGKGANLPIEWKAEYRSPRFQSIYFPDYDVSDLEDVVYENHCGCKRCERKAKNKIFATFGLNPWQK